MMDQASVVKLPQGKTGRKVECAGLSQSGFTLLEVTIALVLMMIVALGSASLFSFSIYNNSAGSDRASALAIAQEAFETLRSAQFDPTTTSALLAGGSSVQSNIVRSGRVFVLTKTIDDNPSTTAVDVNTASTLKLITVSVTPESIGRGWGSGNTGTVTLMTQRTMAE
ncbi:MAG TPA: type II secretion system protein [Pyrinomonadaceae bacterium]|jgi:Tfp pilus assembly protein PilV|nr:type II secretion system protein [Pyrinomonadaceae bacterium]